MAENPHEMLKTRQQPILNKHISDYLTNTTVYESSFEKRLNEYLLDLCFNRA